MFPLLLLTSFLLRIYGNDGMESMSKEQVHPEYRIINLSESDSSLCSSFSCHVDGIPTKIFIPQECAKITEILNGKTVLWRGESCSFLMIHYERNKPVFIVITTEGSHRIQHFAYGKVKWNWVDMKLGGKVLSIKSNIEKKCGIRVDLDWMTNNENFTVISTQLYNSSARILVPNAGYYINKICCGQDIWSYGKERCVFVISHPDDDSPFALYLILKDKNDIMGNLYFVKDGIFGPTTAQEYYSKIVLMSQEHKAVKWANCV